MTLPGVSGITKSAPRVFLFANQNLPFDDESDVVRFFGITVLGFFFPFPASIVRPIGADTVQDITFREALVTERRRVKWVVWNRLKVTGHKRGERIWQPILVSQPKPFDSQRCLRSSNQGDALEVFLDASAQARQQ